MNLLRPVSNWISRLPAPEPTWLEGLDITQADIDGELLHPDASPLSAAAWPFEPQPMAVSWYAEELRA